MSDYRVPGVFIEELPPFPPRVTPVPTNIPVFIGCTEKADDKVAGDLHLKPTLIQSLLEYEKYFGAAPPEHALLVTFTKADTRLVSANATLGSKGASVHNLYYALQLFYANGGGKCYIVSVNTYADAAGKLSVTDFEKGLNASAAVDEISLITIPESIYINSGGNSSQHYYSLWEKVMRQCEELHDRFAVFDVFPVNKAEGLRNDLTNEISLLKFGAAYYPRIFTSIDYSCTDEALVSIQGIVGVSTLQELKVSQPANYNRAKGAIRAMEMLLPASPAVVGQYVANDDARGVWKAPANLNIALATKPELSIDNQEQEEFNVHPSGKSINIIRSFPSRGQAIIWGARTLAGNDNEWRYIPVRRFFNFVEESVKKSTGFFVFETNDQNTWSRARAMIENFLTEQWKAGALQGTTPKEAYYVRIGLGQTMTQLDVAEGRMIIEIGMAVIRPAEFIILRVMHTMISET